MEIGTGVPYWLSSMSIFAREIHQAKTNEIITSGMRSGRTDGICLGLPKIREMIIKIERTTAATITYQSLSGAVPPRNSLVVTIPTDSAVLLFLKSRDSKLVDRRIRISMEIKPKTRIKVLWFNNCFIATKLYSYEQDSN